MPALDGFFLTGGIYHTERQWANSINTDRLPSYTTFDLGLPYQTRWLGNDTTLRLNVANVTAEKYWANA